MIAALAEDEAPPLELNSCAAEELARTLGIDGELAQRVLDYRPYFSLQDVARALRTAISAGKVDLDALQHQFWVRPSRLFVAGNVLQCWENTTLRIPGGVDNVKRAWFGKPTCAWQDGKGRGTTCTDSVIKRMRCNALGQFEFIVACACLGGDPAPGVFKQLRLELFLEGHVSAEDASMRVFADARAVPSWPRWAAFVRHAQAGHNVDNALVSNPDNVLTDDGVAQACAASCGIAGEAVRSAQLVITSPLRRAMQTTGLLLGPDRGDARVCVDALGTERYSARCDEGTPKSVMMRQAPQELPPGMHNFREWEGWDTLPEHWWPSPEEDSWERAEAFRSMAQARPEDRVVFVGHGAFWGTVLGKNLSNCEIVFCDRAL